MTTEGGDGFREPQGIGTRAVKRAMVQAPACLLRATPSCKRSAVFPASAGRPPEGLAVQRVLVAAGKRVNVATVLLAGGPPASCVPLLGA